MTTYDLYGFLSDEIGKAKSLLEVLLGIHFEGRESDYQGGDYFQFGGATGEHFVLKRNVDPIDGEPAEMSFPAHKVLFYVNDTARSSYLQKKLVGKEENFVLLRHEDLE